MSLRPSFGMSLRGAASQATASASARRAVEPQRSPSPKPDLKLVHGSDAPRLERLSARARIIGLVGMVAVVLFGVVAFHVVLSQGQFQLESLQVKADKEQSQYERLRLQVAQLESPSRITSEAQNRLGMVPAEKVTPVTPNQADLPNGLALTPKQPSAGPATPSTTDDPGAWSRVKPHLSSTAP